jgi:hypothetical protein
MQNESPSQKIPHADAAKTDGKSEPSALKSRTKPRTWRYFAAWVLGAMLLAGAAALFLKAFLPALVLIGMGFVIHPQGKEFLFRFFGIDLCLRCRNWLLIFGALLFLASLGWMSQSQTPPTPIPSPVHAVP